MFFNPLTDKSPYGASVKGQPTVFTFTVPASAGVERVFVIVRKGGEHRRAELRFERFEGDDAVYVGDVTVHESGLWYYRFESVSKGATTYYGRGSGGDAVSGEWLPEWQLTVSERDYKTPDWAKSGVMYQIFADRFARAGKTEFRKKGRLHADWYETPDVAPAGEDYAADDFFGGNAEGIISKLDYLDGLGVKVLYLTPVFSSASNHRYDTADYLSIDELFGDEKSFAKLCRAAHERGMHVILDGVFNHTGADSVYFNKFGTYPEKGAYQGKDSPYYDWFYFYDYPDDYHCWWGSTVVPTVNKSAAGYRKLICGKGGVIDKWTKAGADGWRLDVVDGPVVCVHQAQRRGQTHHRRGVGGRVGQGQLRHVATLLYGRRTGRRDELSFQTRDIRPHHQRRQRGLPRANHADCGALSQAEPGRVYDIARIARYRARADRAVGR